jgi:Mn-dependent DtxR family transcriptional regulator
MTKPDPNIKILRAIAGGARSLAELKKVLRRDVRGAVNQLAKDGSVEKVEGSLTLTKRGAGRLRFAS